MKMPPNILETVENNNMTACMLACARTHTHTHTQE